MRITIQSLPFGVHAPAGTVTVANPSAEVSDVDVPLLVPPSTGGGVPPELGVQTVKLTRNDDDLPDASARLPVRVCNPGASGPVL